MSDHTTARSGRPQPDATAPVRHVEHDGGGAFVIEEHGKRIAELTYAFDREQAAVLNHTYVSETLRGRGVAQQLVEAAVDWARGARIKVVPVCTYARAVFERHRELADVLRH